MLAEGHGLNSFGIYWRLETFQGPYLQLKYRILGLLHLLTLK